MDDPQRDIDRVEKRIRRSWFDDGLAEMAAGSGFLLVAAYIFLAPAFERRVPSPVLNLVWPALVLGGWFAARHAVRLAKQRYVHPRTGYLSLDRKPAHPVASTLASLTVAAILAFIAARAQALHGWIPALTALVIAAAFLAFGRQTGMVRFPLEGLSCALVGLLLSLRHVGENPAIAALFGWVGFILIAGGAAALLAYVRHAPPPADDGSENAPREGQ